MGAGESSSNLDHNGCFLKTGKPCNCGLTHKKVKILKYVASRISPLISHAFLNITSKLIGRNYVHKSIEILFKCKKCKVTGHVSLGYSKDGIYFKWGYYRNKSLLVKESLWGNQKNPQDLNLQKIVDFIESLKAGYGFSPGNYQFGIFDCRTFANKIWYKF